MGYLFCRHVVAAVGTFPATPEHFAEVKRRKASMLVVVGGVSEVFLQGELGI